MSEIWKDVVGFEGYKISTKGKLLSFKRKKFPNGYLMSQSDDKDCYKKVTLTKDRKEYTVRIHRLMAEAFIPNPENKPTVNHKDGIKYHNYIENLEWATVSENTQHAYDTGLNEHVHENHPAAKKYEVYKNGKLVGCFDNTYKLTESLKIERTTLMNTLRKNKLLYDVFKIKEVGEFINIVNLNIELIPSNLKDNEYIEKPIAFFDQNMNLISVYTSLLKCEEINGFSRSWIGKKVNSNKLYKNKYYIKSIKKYDYIFTPKEKRNLVI